MTNNMVRCLIIDDEMAAHYSLISYINKLDYLELAGQCFNAVEGINFLNKNLVDVIFLDINMPELNGIDFINALENPPKIILTTAYKEYALKGYDYGVVDYLLKPVSFSRFAKAAERINKLLNPNNSGGAEQNIFVKVERGFNKIEINDIYYVQSEGNFTKIFFKNHHILGTITTSELEQKLPSNKFIRIHKSYIINMEKIESYDNKSVLLLNNYIPIGITYRREFTSNLDKYNN